MRTKSWRRLLGPLLVAVAAGVVLPESAQAQQTGLFPLHPIKRQRVPCSQEDPVYRIYKDQYFGYHPTLWRRFPSGWGAPSPEAPDAKASFKEIPLQPPDWYNEDEDANAAPPEGGPARPDAPQPNLPTPPDEDERSPFEMDAPRPGGATPPPAEPAPRNEPAPPADDPNRSPFDLPGAPRADAPKPGLPDLAPPSTPSASRGRPTRSTEAEVARAGSPLLAMPDTSVDEAYEAPVLGGPALAPAGGHDHDHAAAAARNNQAPRRGRIAAMMDNLGWNVSRR